MSNGGSTTEGTPANPTAAGSSWQDHPVAITVAAAAGAAIVATALYLGGYFDTGDEPPIVVKNGSLQLQLLTNSREWRDDGGPRKWKISGGTRGKDTLDVTIAANAGATCSATGKSGNDLTVTYSDGTKVEIKSNGRRTKITSSGDLTVVGPKKRMLTYAGGGFINSIVLDSTTLCTFADKTQLSNMVVSDF